MADLLGERLVERVRQAQGLLEARRAGAPALDDLVARDFTADAANRLWLTDINEHWTACSTRNLHWKLMSVFSGRTLHN